MPEYDYICTSCNESFSVRISYTDYEKESKAVRCSKCKSKAVKRKITLSPIIFKGNGFTLSKAQE